MVWLRLDDNMLDHPKWRRALRAGGDTALIVWWRLYSWCSRFLTDGEVPADMVDEVADLGFSKVRTRALQALVDASLLARRDDGGVTLVDYLQRNPSREHVLSERDRRAKVERTRRGAARVTGHAPETHQERVCVPSQSHPNPIPSHDLVGANAPSAASAASEPPGETLVSVAPLKLEEPEPKTRTRRRRTALPSDFAPDGTAQNLARELRVDLKRELPQFVDHHTSKATLSADWQSSIRTWIRNAAKWGSARSGNRRDQPNQPNAGVTGLEKVREFE